MIRPPKSIWNVFIFLWFISVIHANALFGYQELSDFFSTATLTEEKGEEEAPPPNPRGLEWEQFWSAEGHWSKQ